MDLKSKNCKFIEVKQGPFFGLKDKKILKFNCVKVLI